MEHIWITVFGLVGLLGLASLMLPLANRLNIPHTVLLAAVGCILGIIGMEADFDKLGIFGDFLSGVRGIEITSEAVLFIFLPGERIVKKGDHADAMYFISSGCIQIDLEEKPAHLGTGDFFGEIGLMKDAPRMADVIAIGYCELLILYAPDFLTLLKSNLELADTIRQIAGERLGKTGY